MSAHEQESAPPPNASRQIVIGLLKTAVTVAVLAVLFARVDWSDIKSQLANIDPLSGGMGLIIKAVGIAFAALRWRSAVRAAGGRIGAAASLRVMMTGLFFGQGLPGVLGGDLVRGWLTYRAGNAAGVVAGGLVLDRLFALAACLLLVVLALTRLPQNASAILALTLVMIVTGAAVLLMAERIPLPASPILAQLRAMVLRARGAIASRQGLAASAAALAVHLCTIGASVAFARALHMTAANVDIMAVVPLAIFAAALPISLNGWGTREGAYVVGLGLFGVAPAQALTLSLMSGLSEVLLALPGGALWLFSSDRAKPDSASSIWSSLRT